MSLDFETVLIAVVFASQIAVLSFFTPHQRRKNHAFLLANYPPAEYPRLYPVSKEEMVRRLALFKPVHVVIGLAALATFLAGLVYADNAAQYGRWMFYCLLAQVLPMYLMMPWLLKVARAFRAMPPPSVRSAELRPWRILDFVSPLWITLGLVFQAAAVTGVVLLYSYERQTLVADLYIGIVSLAVLLRMTYVLLTPPSLVRADPYMAPEDTLRVRKRRFTLLFRGGTTLGAFFVFMMLLRAQFIRFDVGYLWVGMSIMFQVLGLVLVSAQKRDLHTRNFSVYRPESGAPAA